MDEFEELEPVDDSEWDDDFEDDGQPSLYDELQDLPWGGDDDPIYSEEGFFDDW